VTTGPKPIKHNILFPLVPVAGFEPATY